MTHEHIIAYVDGELSPIEALRFERAMAADPALAAEVDSHRRLRETVASHFAPIAAQPLPDRLSGPLKAGAEVVRMPARPRLAPAQGARYAALAAMLVAGLVAGQFLPRSGAPFDVRDDALIARGALADALDRQLASAAPPDAAYRIGVSFRAAGNRYCRTFSGKEGGGLGCRDREGWTLERFVAATPARGRTAYRQASSASTDILAAAQEMMVGVPLDAEQERAARERDWAVGAR